MLNIKSLIAATVLSGVAALSFAATAEAPAAAPAAAAPAAAAKPTKKVVHHVKKVKKMKATDAVAK